MWIFLGRRSVRIGKTVRVGGFRVSLSKQFRIK